MIILLGPDGTGKSALAEELSSNLGMELHHHTQHTTYQEFLEPVLDVSTHQVFDRFIWCEYAYADTRRDDRGFRFSLKEFHNVTLLALMRNPLVVLCCHIPESYEEDVLPKENWTRCYLKYSRFLEGHRIPYILYDYCGPKTGLPVIRFSYRALELEYDDNWNNSISFPTELRILSYKLVNQMNWWRGLWLSGQGAVGSPHPKLLLVAERLGPRNSHFIPFEAGPTGMMLSSLLETTHVSYGDIAVTNLVKAPLGSSRPIEPQDYEKLELELTTLKPDGVLFMGSIARNGMKISKKLGIPSSHIVHLGYYNHRGIRDVKEYSSIWRERWKELTGETLQA